jgi:hypothetical protein
VRRKVNQRLLTRKREDALVRLTRDAFVRAHTVDDALLEQLLGIARVAGNEN